MCEDAADGAYRIAELLHRDNDPTSAEVFSEISDQAAEFARRLSVMVVRHRPGGATYANGTTCGKLFLLRLRIAQQIAVGYRDVDDRRKLLRIARRGSDLVSRAYANAESRLWGYGLYQEVHRQAELLRSADDRIRHIAASAR